MTSLEILQITVLSDNYVYLIRDADSGECAVVDPGTAGPVLESLKDLGWPLTHVLCTHHHADHVGGAVDVKNATGCTVIGARKDAKRIPGIDTLVGDGETIAIGGHQAAVLETPGHTSGHICYWFGESGALFCGDTLFSLGCGRLFEGTPEQMWTSLCRLRALPDDARVYCGHEYTNSNCDFALSVDPDNPALKRRAEEVLALRQAGKPTVPSTIGEEKAVNPFLRADDESLQRAVGLEGRDAVSVFAEIRSRKDRF